MKENLEVQYWFDTPIYVSHIEEWVKPLNKICNGVIKETQILNKDVIKNKEKHLNKKIGDFGMSHHSKSLLTNNLFDEFKKYTQERSIEVLNDMGYDSKEAYLGWGVLNMATLLGEKAGCKDYVLEHHSNHQEVANLIIDTLDIKEAQQFKGI